MKRLITTPHPRPTIFKIASLLSPSSTRPIKSSPMIKTAIRKEKCPSLHLKASMHQKIPKLILASWGLLPPLCIPSLAKPTCPSDYGLLPSQMKGWVWWKSDHLSAALAVKDTSILTSSSTDCTEQQPAISAACDLLSKRTSIKTTYRALR